MKLTEQIQCAIEDAERGKFESAMLHACIAIDATAKRLYPSERLVGKRYIDCIRNYYWLIEPLLGAGINLEETKFRNVKLTKNEAPDFAEIIYEVFRCNHAHGDEVPTKFSLTLAPPGSNLFWSAGAGSVHLPGTILWALIGLVVFSKANAAEKTTSGHYLSLWNRVLLISEWWGRENDFRTFVASQEAIRITFDLSTIKSSP